MLFFRERKEGRKIKQQEAEQVRLITDRATIEDNISTIEKKVEDARKKITSPFVHESPAMDLKTAVRKAWLRWITHGIDPSDRLYIHPITGEEKKLSDEAVKVLDDLRRGDLDLTKLGKLASELAPYIFHKGHDGVRELMLLYALQGSEDPDRTLVSAFYNLFQEQVIAGITANVIKVLRNHGRFQKFDDYVYRSHFDRYSGQHIHLVGDTEEIERLINEAVEEAIKRSKDRLRLPKALRDPEKVGEQLKVHRENYAYRWQSFLAKGTTDVQEFLVKEHGIHPEKAKRLDEYISKYGLPNKFHDADVVRPLSEILARKLAEKIWIHKERLNAYRRLSEILHDVTEIARDAQKYREILKEIDNIMREHGQK